MFTETPYKYVVLDSSGIAMIAGTSVKVVDLIEAQQLFDWNITEYLLHYPDLTMGQIHSALAYYWDHQEALEQVLQQRRQSEVRSESAALSTASRGEDMAAALEKLAQINAFQDVDPVTWQKDIRKDKPLSGRE